MGSLTSRHTYMTTTQGHSHPEWDDVIADFHNMGVVPDDTWRTDGPDTLNREYWRRGCARVLEL